MTTFVLVSGAWHAPWCWQRLIPLIEAQGYNVIAPDLLGMGDDPTPLDRVTLADWAEQVAAIVTAQAEPVVLVGHSRGGIVISTVAERIPERIATLVYLAAFLLPDGGTLMQAAMSVPSGPTIDFLLPGDHGGMKVAPAAVGPVFYNRTDQAWVDVAVAHIGVEPPLPAATAVRVSDDRFGSVRRAYIECIADNAVPLPLQRAMQARLPCDPVITLDTDHSPFFSAPQLLTDSLIAIAAAGEA